MTEHNDTMVEAIALSSPSGRMSKRARKAADERLRLALFGPDGLQRVAQQPSMAESLRRQAAQLQSLAAKGMKPRAYRKEAARLEQEADELERAEEDVMTPATQAKAER